MRKTILMGLGLAAALAGTAAAQQGGHEGHGTRQRQDSGRVRFGMRGGAPDRLLLRGITLTDAQKTQLQALHASQREQMKVRREATKKEFDAIRDARQRGDTAAARAQAQRMRQTMAQAREQQLAAVRNILSAEQRVQFDKNVAELAARQKERRTERREAKGR